MLNKTHFIPDGWQEKTLGDVCSMFSGGTPSKQNKDFWNGNIKWLSARYIENDKIIGCDYITEAGLKNSSAKIANANDTILVTRVSVGKQVFLEESFAVNQDLTILQANNLINKKFLFFIIKKHKNEIIDKSQGLAIKGITKDELADINILLPPLPEQEGIAGVLDEWDNALGLLKRRIELKKLQKRGLMQKMLTVADGTTAPILRPHGFTTDWKVVKLGEIGTLFNGLTGKNKDDFGAGNPFITYMAIYSEPTINANKLSLVNVSDNENQNSVKYGDVFFTTSSETPDEVGISSVLLYEPNIKTYLNSFCTGFRLNNFDSLSPVFASFYLRSEYVRKQMYRFAQGAIRYNLSRSELLKLNLSIPATTDEQSAIADILVAADDEIALLERQRTAIEKQKAGLMQKLLTGEVRVKTTTPSSADADATPSPAKGN
ncbi:MAG: restriction endonuclease subunit S [Rickettsiales bacterium]|jgi:type I restriction enzyme S subunit|nr:restriction endonuclease subunit S [Rickettsiales bacterium]